LKTGALASTCNLFYELTMKKLEKNQDRHDQFHLLAAILAQWWCPVASSKAMDLLHRAMRAVMYRRIAMAIGMASKVDVSFHCCCFAWEPGSCRGNTEQLVARWWGPKASGIALDILHWAMCSILLQCICMAIEMARDRGTFVHHRLLFCLTNHSHLT
jgi:hypothetical protein